MQPIFSYFSHAWDEYRTNLSTMATYNLILLGILLIGVIIQYFFISVSFQGSLPLLDTADVVWMTIQRVLTSILLAWVSIALIGTTYEIVSGHTPHTQPMAVLRMTLRSLLPAIAISILTTLAIFFGLLFLIVPGLILSVWLSFALYALIIEEKGVWQSLKRSKALVHGHFWPVLGRLFVFTIVIALLLVVVNTLIVFLFSVLNLDPVGNILQTILSISTVPYVTLMMTRLYIELRQLPTADTTPSTPVTDGATAQ